MCVCFCSLVCVRQGFLHFPPFDLCYKMQISWGQGHVIAFFLNERIYFVKIIPFHLFLTISSLTPAFQSLQLLKVSGSNTMAFADCFNPKHLKH